MNKAKDQNISFLKIKSKWLHQLQSQLFENIWQQLVPQLWWLCQSVKSPFQLTNFTKRPFIHQVGHGHIHFKIGRTVEKHTTVMDLMYLTVILRRDSEQQTNCAEVNNRSKCICKLLTISVSKIHKSWLITFAIYLASLFTFSTHFHGTKYTTFGFAKTSHVLFYGATIVLVLLLFSIHRVDQIPSPLSRMAYRPVDCPEYYANIAFVRYVPFLGTWE